MDNTSGNAPLTGEEVAHALVSLGVDPDAERIRELQAAIDANALPAGDREEAVREAVETASRRGPMTSDRDTVLAAYGQTLVPASYDYVWELEGNTGFPAYLDIGTGLVFVSHDYTEAEQAHPLLMREELVLAYPAAAGQRDDHFITLPVGRGRVSAEAFDAFYRTVATLCREPEVVKPVVDTVPTVLDVALAMERTGGLSARPWASVEPRWMNDPQTNRALDAGVDAGYLLRLSPTALQWTEAGVAARDAARATAAVRQPVRPVRARMFAWINDECGYLPVQVVRDVSNDSANTTPRLAGERVFEVGHVTGPYRGQYTSVAERHLFDAVPADASVHERQIRRYELAALYTELDAIHARASVKARYGLSRDDNAGPYLSTNDEVARYRTLKTSIDAARRAAHPGAPVTADEVAAAYAATRRGTRAEYVGGGRIRVTNHNTPSLAVRYVTVPQARAAIEARSAIAGTNALTPEHAAKRDADTPAREASPSLDL